jgi:hypothetical protein
LPNQNLKPVSVSVPSAKKKQKKQKKMNSNHQDQDTDGYSRDQSLFEINELYRKANVQNFLAFQEFQRVLNSLSANQESLNAKHSEEQQHQTKELVLETSQHLRNNIWSICGDLSSTAETIASHDQEPEKLIPVLEQHHTILQNIYQYWNLIEIFFLNDSQFLSYEMISWLQSEKFSTEEFFEAFHSMTHPERYESTEWGYWDCVYEFIIQGKILQAMEFLKLHSEFTSFFHPRNEEENDSTSSSAPSIPGKKSFNSPSSSSFTAEQVQEFFSLLQLNPSLSLLSVCSQGNSNLSYRERQQLYSQYNNQSNSSAFSQWSSSVAHYREKKPFLLLRVPEIDFLLSLLSGEDRAIEIQSRGSWKSRLLGRLVYRYSNTANSNQLTKANLRRILSEVLVTHNTNSHGNNHHNNNNSNNSIATTEMEVLTSISAGQIGRTMKMIIESSAVLSHFPSSSSSSSSSSVEEEEKSTNEYTESHFSALVLLLAVHLSHLLLIGGKGMAGISELAVRTAPLDISSFPLSASFSSYSSSCNISFIEEITLRALEPIQRLLYREELIREYLSALSSAAVTANEVFDMDKNSRLLYREILLRRPIFTDEECLRISGLLYQEGWISESKSILLLRGIEWLAKGREGEKEEPAAVSRGESTVSKAVWFFLAAENYPRVEAILDSALHRCMETTVDCSEVIFNQQSDRLSLRPGRPALSRRPVDDNNKNNNNCNNNENEEQEDDFMMETNGTFVVLIICYFPFS